MVTRDARRRRPPLEAPNAAQIYLLLPFSPRKKFIEFIEAFKLTRIDLRFSWIVGKGGVF